MADGGSAPAYLKERAAHPGHVHEHDAGVDARPAVERVAGKAAVPGDARLLVLRGHGGQLGGVEPGQEGPQAVDGLQEQDVRVHVHDGVHVLEDQLQRDRRCSRCYLYVFSSILKAV